MMRVVFIVVTVLSLTGCLFRGKPKPPPPVETVETTRLRADSLWREANGHFRHARWAKLAEAMDRTLLIMQYDDPRRPRGLPP